MAMALGENTSTYFLKMYTLYRKVMRKMRKSREKNEKCLMFVKSKNAFGYKMLCMGIRNLIRSLVFNKDDIY